jgi:hypothetical protein
MDSQQPDFIKHREIAFSALHPSADQAQVAACFLADAPGVQRAEPITTHLLAVSYDLRCITLEEIDCSLVELGLHLSCGLIHRIKRALYYYAEETQRANCGCPRGQSNCTDRVFVTRYQRLNHNCRDTRPEHWRRYL